GRHVREFDVVHIHAVFSHACLAAAKACRRYSVPYVVSPHGMLDPWSLRQKHLRKNLLWQIGVKSMLQKATAVHYTTSEEQRLVHKQGGQARVIFPGWLEGNEKAAALREAALLALPSHQENFGLAVVEALACKVPVLLSTQVNLAGEIEAAEAGWSVPLETAA